jgi:hypothetical protein
MFPLSERAVVELVPKKASSLIPGTAVPGSQLLAVLGTLVAGAALQECVAAFARLLKKAIPEKIAPVAANSFALLIRFTAHLRYLGVEKVVA